MVVSIPDPERRRASVDGPWSDLRRRSLAAPVLRRWASLARLNAGEVALLAELCRREEATLPGCDLVEHAPSAMLILDGWACHLRLLTDGRRQIVRFLLPGDGVALGAWPEPLGPPVALTRVRWADAAQLRDAAFEPARWPGLAAAMQRSRMIEGAQLVDHIVRLGGQSGYQRVAHLLLELHDRSAAAGLAVGEAFPLPITQEILGDALGLSTVHINRILQQMRAEKQVAVAGGWASLLKPEHLTSIADFTARAASL